MNTNFIKKVALIGSVAVLLSACSGDSSSVSGIDNTDNSVPSIGFAFPDVDLSDADSVGTVNAPQGALPEFSARRTLSAGDGDVVVYGDPVQLRYNMYSWTDGTLVESTDSFDEAVIIDAGASQGVPTYLANSVLGRNKGETVQIIFEAGLDDLPAYLDNSDAYIMVLQIL